MREIWWVILIFVLAFIVVGLELSNHNKEVLSGTVYCKSKGMVLMSAAGDYACVPGEYIK
jgi:hypothetical protein